ncbi:MAG: hypothetical protein ACR2MG_16485 [Pyrinomonadaceae bacterium]
MTQQQIVQEFRSYPKAKKSVVIRQLLRIFEADLEINEAENNLNGKELFIEERHKAIQRLRGIAKVAGKPAPTDDEIKEDYTEYLLEKYK